MVEQNIRFELLKGPEILPYLSDLATLRIQVFNEYPYLYVGNESYEKEYLSTYANCSDSYLIIIKDKDTNKTVGASTAIPLKLEADYCTDVFKNSNYNIKDIFYFGESVLLPEYRNQGLYKHIFKYREAEARKQGYKYATFCGVKRPPDDPRKPDGYQPLDTVWQKYGYSKHDDIKGYYSWQEIGETKKSEKEMIFWLKELDKI